MDTALAMHIARAYCVDAAKVVDIYQARALFFAQEEPRRRLEFLCSDDACRVANGTRVTGVNYDKLVEDDRDRVIVKPHFRMNPDTPHSPACEWVARERAWEALGCADVEPDRRGRAHHFRHLKASDLVDVFVPSVPETTSMLSMPSEPRPRAPAARDARDSGREDEPGRRGRSNLTRADLLETVVSAYELLAPEERREVALRIARGPKLPYSKAFCRIEHYFAAPPARIFHGGVQVRAHGPNFAVQFFDHVLRAGEPGRDHPLEVSLYLKRDALLRHWNGRFLLAQLTEASKRGHYAHCYFYGRLVDHAKLTDRVVVELETLEHLAFTVRKTARASLPDPSDQA
jgi:hypothetical protein